MCGFAGFWDFKKRHANVELDRIVTRMSDQIIFRGPDSSGAWTDERYGLALAHRRLAIIDLSKSGHQPMVSQSGRSVIAYNGEIYNTDELRKLLSNEGVLCTGTSDTEVLLEACELWGVERALKAINGMFAFVLWDKASEKIVLARDRLGIKPLFFGFHHGVLYFTSQLRTLTAHPNWQPEINRDTLTTYFRFNYIPSPLSIYKGIQKLRPGYFTVINGEQNVSEQCYWSLERHCHPLEDEEPLGDEIIVEEFDRLLRDAVKRRMRSDVPLGAFLSGGIDSSTVVALMQSQSDRPVKTFSIGFNEKEYNEACHAKSIALHLGTEHHELYLPVNDAATIIPDLAGWYDEPFADSSQIPTYLVSKLAREHVTVSLSGDGGDELLAGYPRYLLGSQFYSRIKKIPLFLRIGLSRSIRCLSPATWDAVAKCIPKKFRPRHIGNKAYKLSNILLNSPEDFYKTLVSVWNSPEDLVYQGVETYSWPQVNQQLTYVERMQFMDTVAYLPDDILTKVDRASMAVSLEARVPLLDHRVVELAWRLPMRYKLHGNETKWLLRRILEKHVPASLFTRPKMGFSVPIAEWLRGTLREWAEDLLSERKLQQGGYLNSSLIQKRWNEHLSGARNWEYALWGVLMFQSWYERYHHV